MGVGWIATFTDMLSLALVVGGLLAHREWLERRRWGWIAVGRVGWIAHTSLPSPLHAEPVVRFAEVVEGSVPWSVPEGSGSEAALVRGAAKPLRSAPHAGRTCACARPAALGCGALGQHGPARDGNRGGAALG